ncbi:MAG: hypothetical protein Q620_VSAC00207G0002, partial [Veillonella sp. DORA_A_3_16_22]
QLRYISHYPDATNDDVLNAIADTYGMDKHQIIVGNGAAELLYAICIFQHARYSANMIFIK